VLENWTLWAAIPFMKAMEFFLALNTVQVLLISPLAFKVEVFNRRFVVGWRKFII